MRAMSPAAGPLPTGSGWGYEMSWPGTQLFIDVAAGQVRVLAEDRDVTRRWPELVTMCTDIGDALLEGYLIEADADEMDGATTRYTLGSDAPVAFVCSDLLRLYGVNLEARPYSQRRGSLARLAEGHPLLTLSPVFDDAEATAAAAREHGLDGVVAKRLDSPYRPGIRSPDWIRYSFTDADAEAGSDTDADSGPAPQPTRAGGT